MTETAPTRVGGRVGRRAARRGRAGWAGRWAVRPRLMAEIGAYVAASALYLIWCVHLPVQFNAYADKDDAYFITSAIRISAGEWLGPYDQLTLIKGPGFAYFLVANHLLGTPSTLTLAALFAASCGALVRVLHRCVSLPRWGALALFLVLLLQPALMPTRVIRDSLYTSLLLLTVAGVVTVVLDRRRHAVLRGLAWGLPLGLFWITREEGIWVVPGVALLVLAGAWARRRALRDLAAYGASVAALVLGALVPVLGTSAVNQHVYGTFVVSDLGAAPFQSMMAELDSISAGREIPHVTVSRSALRAAYRASPAFRELRPSLSSPDNFWLGPGCSVYPQTCGQYGGGWFGWAVRDAAAAAGHYHTASEASSYYSEVADQLAAACDDGRLTCDAGVVPVGPVVSREALRALPATMLRGVLRTTYHTDDDEPLITTVGTAERVDEIDDFLGGPLLTTRTDPAPAPAPEDADRWVDAREHLRSAYSVLTPVVLLVGGAGFVGALLLVATRRPVRRATLVVAAVCWLLYTARLGLVSLIDITSAPAVTTLYLAPAFLLVPLASALSVLALATGLRRPDAPEPAASGEVRAPVEQDVLEQR